MRSPTRHWFRTGQVLPGTEGRNPVCNVASAPHSSSGFSDTSERTRFFHGCKKTHTHLHDLLNSCFPGATTDRQAQSAGKPITCTLIHVSYDLCHRLSEAVCLKTDDLPDDGQSTASHGWHQACETNLRLRYTCPLSLSSDHLSSFVSIRFKGLNRHLNRSTECQSVYVLRSLCDS